MLSFWLDDDCQLEQLAQILPTVASYETGMLDYLLRGELTISLGETIVVTGKNIGAGSVDIILEDERGVRRFLAHSDTPGGRELLSAVAAPASGTRVLAIFRGVDLKGEPMIAVGAMPLAKS